MLRHGNCNSSLQQTSARDTYNFSSCENGAFLLVEATVCCPFYYWSEIEVVRTKIVMQSAYTSAIERSLLLLSCDYFWNLIGTANFQAAEVTVWTRGSCARPFLLYWNCFMLSSLPCFYAFCWSAIPTSCYIFNVFYSCKCYIWEGGEQCCKQSHLWLVGDT